MPLRQSLLNFYRGRNENPKPTTTAVSETRPVLARTPSSTSSETDPDTIVVSSNQLRPQLPTPSESSLDVSLQDGQVLSMKEVPKGRARRVSQRVANNQSQAGLVANFEDEMAKERTVSGETLVNLENASQSTLLKESLSALDLPWNMSQIFTKEGRKDLSGLVNDTVDALPTEDAEEVEDPEEERLREERAAAKKAKMAANEKMWEQRRKTADKHATRRSSRAPLLDRASEVVSSIANSVLGKRKDRPAEESGGSRPKSIGGTHATPEEPSTKKRRVTQGDATISDEPAQARRSTRHQDKKYLTSGLYAGQPRTFDGRLTETKNKRKSEAITETFKDNKILPLPMFAGERVLKQGRDFKLPFDVFSPLPAGQPKPDEWKKVNKNVFVGDAAQAWRVNKFEEQSNCLCKPETGCDSDCMNRYMYYECDERNCNLGPENCGNRAFEGLRQRVKKGGKFNVGVEVIKTEDRGYGVRSNRMFDANQIIVEYTGEIITQEECERRMNTMYKNNEVSRQLDASKQPLIQRQCYYLMLFDQNMIIDATRGSMARFVNHSCEPNCRMEKWTVNGKPRMALFAGDRGIMTGEELTYDYNFDPYSQKNVQECRCGSEKCRGVLGPRSKEEKKQKSPEVDTSKGRGKLAGAKRKIAQAIEETTTRITKKVKVTATPKAKVYSRKSASPVKGQKAKAVRKAVSRKTSTVVAKRVIKNPSKLKKVVVAAGNKTLSKAKSKMAAKRVASYSSSVVPMTPHIPERTSSLREKVISVKSRVVRTVRGAPSGQRRSVRAVVDEEDVEMS